MRTTKRENIGQATDSKGQSWTLYHRPAGFVVAGSGLAYGNEVYGVSTIIKNATHGRQFKTLKEATDHLEMIIK